MEPFRGGRPEFPGRRRLDFTLGWAQFTTGRGLHGSRRNSVRGLNPLTRRWLNGSGRRLRHSFRHLGGDFRIGQRPELRPGLHALRPL